MKAQNARNIGAGAKSKTGKANKADRSTTSGGGVSAGKAMASGFNNFTNGLSQAFKPTPNTRPKEAAAAGLNAGKAVATGASTAQSMTDQLLSKQYEKRQTARRGDRAVESRGMQRMSKRG